MASSKDGNSEMLPRRARGTASSEEAGSSGWDRRIRDAELTAMPAVLFIALPLNGKTETLKAWAAIAAISLVDRQQGDDDTDKDVHDLISFHDTGKTPRTKQVQDYIVKVDRQRVRLIDVPGEIVNDANSLSSNYRAALAKLSPRIEAVVILVQPPANVPRGGLADVPQLEQDSTTRALDQQDTLLQLDRSLAFADATLSMLGISLDSCAVVVQIGFADVTDFAGDGEAIAEYRAACEAGWPPGARLSVNRRAVEARKRSYPQITGVVQRAFPWILTSALARYRRVNPWVILQANLGALGLDKYSKAMGLAYVLDMIVGRRVLAAARTRWLRPVAAALAVLMLAALAAAGAGAWAYRRAPQWLPATLASRSCLDAEAAEGPGRCACLDILMRANGEDAVQQAYLVERYRVACGGFGAASVPADAALAAAVVQADLVHGLTVPDDLCLAKLRAAKKVGLALPRGRPETPWFPARTPGEVAAVSWLAASVDGELAGPPRDVLKALTVAERSRFSGLRKLLERAAVQSDCYVAWANARQGGAWAQAVKACRHPDVVLPVGVAERLLADAPTTRAWSPATAGPASPECGEPLTTAAIRPPEADWLTTANRVVRAPDRAEAIIQEGPALPPAVARLLVLLDPKAPYAQRTQVADQLDAPGLRELLELARTQWVGLEDGKLHGDQSRPDGRVAVLPTAAATAAASALIGLAEEDASIGALAWDSTPALPEDHADVLRAKLALALGAREPARRAAVVKGIATWRIYRAGPGGGAAKSFKDVHAALEPLTASLDTEAAARSALCQAAADSKEDDQVEAQLRWFGLRTEAGDAMRARGGTCAAYAVLSSVARADYAVSARFMEVQGLLSVEEGKALEAALQFARERNVATGQATPKPIFDALIARFGQNQRLQLVLDRVLRGLG